MRSTFASLAARPEIEVLVVGETREWEVVEYIQDCIAAGQKKAPFWNPENPTPA